MTRFRYGMESAGGGFVARKGFRRRAGQARAVQVRAVFCIAGEFVTLAGIAERMGLGEDAARERLRRAQAQPGAVTWESLR